MTNRWGHYSDYGNYSTAAVVVASVGVSAEDGAISTCNDSLLGVGAMPYDEEMTVPYSVPLGGSHSAYRSGHMLSYCPGYSLGFRCAKVRMDDWNTLGCVVVRNAVVWNDYVHWEAQSQCYHSQVNNEN